jgi:GNAT superfamily N-acetyltransferase
MAKIKLMKQREKKQELLDLFQASFGHKMSAQLWDWKYIQNPLAPTDPEVIVALDSARIVGARPFQPVQLWLGNEKVRAVQAPDLMVHPDYQRKGINTRMIQFYVSYLKENGYSLIYGFPNAKSLTGALRQGYKIVATEETLFQLMNPQKLISYKLGNKVLGTALGFLHNRFLNIKAPTIFQPRASFHTQLFDQFNNELKGIDTLRDTTKIDLVRDENFLKWRFDQHPEQSYKYFIAKKDGELWGYIVFSVQEQRSGLVNGLIADYLIKDDDIDCFSLLVNECLNELEKTKCDIISVWTFTHPKFREELLKHFNFKSSTRFPYDKVSEKGHFVAREVKEHTLEKIDIYNKSNWRVTLAYTDTA